MCDNPLIGDPNAGDPHTVGDPLTGPAVSAATPARKGEQNLEYQRT
jgi:hypothetical protein